MSKILITFDMDDCIINSNLAIRRKYSHDFKVELPDVIRQWNGLDVLNVYETWIEEAFNSNDFWNYVSIKPGVFEVLDYLKSTNKYSLQICSICHPNNAINKIKFLESNGFNKYFDDYHLIVKTDSVVAMGKDFLTGLVVDDHSRNLKDNPYGILFMDNGLMPYNKDWKGAVATGWDEELINTIEIYAEMIREALC